MEEAVEEVLEALKQENFYWKGKQATKAELIRSFIPEAKDWDQVERAALASGIKDKVKAYAFHRLRAQIPRSGGLLAQSPAVEWAQRQWAEMLLQQLQELSKEQRQPFLRRRPKPLSSKDSAKAQDDEVSTRHIADLKSLFNLITRDLRTREARDSSRGAGRQSTPSATGATLEELQLRYAELSPTYDHLGVPEALTDLAGPPGFRGSKVSQLEATRRSLGQQLLVKSYPAELQIFCRFGVPASLRREIWSKCFDLGAGDGSQALQEAARSICEWEWLTDDVLRLDVAEHCANDVSYFPFDELVEALVLALSRDPHISNLCESGPPQIPIVTPLNDATAPGVTKFQGLRLDVGGDGDQSQSAMPPSGVVPFKGFSNYACPFAFLADRLEVAYPLFRAFYCRHLCRLHSISDHPNTLLSLCHLFEHLVAVTVPRAVHHLFALDASPLRYAFHWIVTGFVGCLPAEQVLQLWDRILGFDRVELVAILAAAVIAFRRKLVLAARRPEEVQLIFADISCIKAIPLLQAFLFASELGLPKWE